jgi:putative transposase
MDALLKGSGVEPLLLPPRSPNLNAHCEPFVRSIKEEALNQMVMLGERILSYAIQQYLAHYHSQRHRQGLGNHLILAEPGMPSYQGQVSRRDRLGGLLTYYYTRCSMTRPSFSALRDHTFNRLK